MFVRISFNKFWFPTFRPQKEAKTCNPNLSDIKSRCVVGPGLLYMSRLEACFVARPHRRPYNSFVCAIWRVKAGEEVAPVPEQLL